MSEVSKELLKKHCNDLAKNVLTATLADLLYASACLKNLDESTKMCELVAKLANIIKEEELKRILPIIELAAEELPSRKFTSRMGRFLG